MTHMIMIVKNDSHRWIGDWLKRERQATYAAQHL
jgi:hypothetical protein